MAQVVPVQMQLSGIHRNEKRDIALISIGAGDDVPGPSGIVLACASTRTLHATVARVEVATSAQIKTMGGVRAQKLGHLRNQHPMLGSLIQLAFQLAQIGDADVTMIGVSAHLVDGLQPFQMTIADQRVAMKKHLRLKASVNCGCEENRL